MQTGKKKKVRMRSQREFSPLTPFATGLLMEALPSELLLHVIWFIDDVKDKCRLSQTCRRLHSLLRVHPWCWSPLDLSPFGEQITNVVLLSILRNCSIPIVLPSDKHSQQQEKEVESDKKKSKSISSVNLSGCWCLTFEAIQLLACSLPELKELHLNRYRPSTMDAVPFEQRDHLYQIRPSHNLSSLAMDLSKEPLMSLFVPETALHTLMIRCPRLVSLSLQYQYLGVDACRTLRHLKHLRHLDISSCVVTQPVLQILLRNVGRRLLTLKMLNIDLTNLTLLGMQQFTKSLTCLHLSCTEPGMLSGITQTLTTMKDLTDFRLTRLRTGCVDPIVYRLPTSLRALDLSPKMDFHPRYPTRSFRRLAGSAGGGISRSQQPPRPPVFDSDRVGRLRTTSTNPKAPSNANGDKGNAWLIRTEHDLDLTDHGLTRIATFHDLRELRLCYPHISSHALARLLPSLHQLQVFELRMDTLRRRSSLPRDNTMSAPPDRPDYLNAIKSVPLLRELGLYHVWISDTAAKDIGCLRNLRQMTIYNGGTFAERNPSSVRQWLLDLPCLQVLRLGRMQLRWEYLDDIVTYTGPDCQTMPVTRNTSESELLFQKTTSRQWQWSQ
ncbi:hypothetical protein BCR43DRAFT_488461 [Syncephalastrum racemosum]|uniref:F-box domain-containing protein n=1 Tax=Syncephalastrum racemosum TaxID=13706 RepID=A0A1X2HIL8_SYNRA|nr:hypothetical protein BCR43DRAFT_488461 [Syncephalastrum racemosum]